MLAESSIVVSLAAWMHQWPLPKQPNLRWVKGSGKALTGVIEVVTELVLLQLAPNNDGDAQPRPTEATEAAARPVHGRQFNTIGF